MTNSVQTKKIEKKRPKLTIVEPAEPEKIMISGLSREEKEKKKEAKRLKKEAKKEAKRLKKENEEKEKKKIEEKEKKKIEEKAKKVTVKKEIHKDIPAEKKIERLKKLKAAFAYGEDYEKWRVGCYRRNLFNERSGKGCEFTTLNEAIEEGIHFISQGEEVTGIVRREKKNKYVFCLRMEKIFRPPIPSQSCKEILFSLLDAE